jgi:DNA-directed RNA polymerase alpha subunit
MRNNIPIEEMSLEVRSLNILKDLKIKTSDDIAEKMPLRTILRFSKGIGIRSGINIIEAMHEIGYKFGIMCSWIKPEYLNDWYRNDRICKND